MVLLVWGTKKAWMAAMARLEGLAVVEGENSALAVGV